MDDMFFGCSSLTSLYLSGLGSDNLTSSTSMFSQNTSLISINMSNFNFGLVEDISCLFIIPNIETVNLSNANTSNITNMNYVFDGDSHLINVNLSGIDTSKVTLFEATFRGCTSLTNLDISDLNTDSATSFMSMFYNCTSLKGGGTPQTTYDSNHTDKEYARIDGGANSNTPGYLTLKSN